MTRVTWRSMPNADKPPTFSDHVAAGVRAERARRRWTQTDLAERAGMSRTAVGDVEAGKRQVTANMIVKFCRALGVPLSVLAAGADPEDLRTIGL